ncbi:hypothetical protein [Brevundimonas sp.]|uniref:hypothetical protein n=1 Tax=Brevundimonas sp. TaxID=1871086 RepID=UPI002D4B4CA1|nr:hypothetical protein [Brevundimonas sp.]HYC74108.1 hypothetical protein [Brevundimonas sp.]
MIQGVAFPISAGLIGLALLAGKLGQDGTAYFPQALHDATVACALGFREAEVMDEHRAGWYGRHLRAAGESPIFDGSRPALRFTWLRSFHAPVVIRLNPTTDGGVLMTATELSGKGGYDPGGVTRRIERRLSAEESAAVARVLETTGALAQRPRDCDLGLDGAQWILESAGPEGYRFVDRWSPREGPVRELGLHLIGLTGWTYDAIY